MKQEGLSYFTDTAMVSVALLIFFTWFIGMVAWVCRDGAKQRNEKLSMIPLRDGGDL